MKTNKNTYNIFNRLSAVFMVIALLWLTVSAPFVFAAQQKISKQDKIGQSNVPVSGNEEETANPFGNTTEEKAPSANSFSEEFLHDHPIADHFFSVVSRDYNSENSGTYIAFHGELHVPPPNAA